jgi:hypothetical protein
MSLFILHFSLKNWLVTFSDKMHQTLIVKKSKNISQKELRPEYKKIIKIFKDGQEKLIFSKNNI